MYPSFWMWCDIYTGWRWNHFMEKLPSKPEKASVWREKEEF